MTVNTTTQGPLAKPIRLGPRGIALAGGSAFIAGMALAAGLLAATSPRVELLGSALSDASYNIVEGLRAQAQLPAGDFSYDTVEGIRGQIWSSAGDDSYDRVEGLRIRTQLP